ncbi:protein ABSCISIC ACID-INSENSITIVE 5-like [Tasmannia lanceolata]|uniref:protein ABSCISIC ACID-INSENSITIVE 5-like n=1 Tax=Tasmannia lanceolata TaxID=3420 RepID=UPI004063DD83
MGTQSEGKSQDFSLMRHSSIYSLTLDEVQHTLCERGKNFGSMNMDEFLSNIWTAEESQALAVAIDSGQSKKQVVESEGQTVTNQSSTLNKQVPSPLCRKTVEEVWSEIHRDQQINPYPNNMANEGSSENAPRQPTLGEMTLEDFLIKAGVVRGVVPSSSSQQQQDYQLFQQTNTVEQDFVIPGERAGFGQGMDLGFSDPHQNTANGVHGGIPGYPGFNQNGLVGEGSTFGGNDIRNGGFPVSPMSSDGMGPSQVDNSASQYRLEMGGMMRVDGRNKIIMDGPVEKVVEKRQRRMIKNRESAARSRARKQAYTVELEAELNQLKEENARIRKEMEEEEKKRKWKFIEEFRQKTVVAAREGKKLRRSRSCPR